MNSLLKAVSEVTKEVFIRLFEFSATDLQQLIKAACGVERIIIHCCSIHCSAKLDFGADTKYKTKFLSLQLSGNSNCKELTTDWIEDPQVFSNIVDAIGNSGLRDSLTKISIAFNDTLDKTKVLELFSAKGMPHISVVEENPNPSFT